MANKIEPVPNEPYRGGFTDVGDVSYITPTMDLTVPTFPQGIAIQTWMATASHGTTIGFKGAVTASKVLALTGIDLLTDPELLEQAKADFEQNSTAIALTAPRDSVCTENHKADPSFYVFTQPVLIADIYTFELHQPLLCL